MPAGQEGTLATALTELSPRRRRGGDLRGTVRGVLNCGAPSGVRVPRPDVLPPQPVKKLQKKFPQKKSVSRSFVVFINREAVEKRGTYHDDPRRDRSHRAPNLEPLCNVEARTAWAAARRWRMTRIRPCFQRDRDRILHCKAFRRLKQKTQVFLSPEGDHYRTRLTHTLEVSQIARTIARALRLNEDLTEAIALGHDLGHTPFGHAGERALNRLCPGGFTHYQPEPAGGGLAGEARRPGPEPDLGGAQWHRDPHVGRVGPHTGGLRCALRRPHCIFEPRHRGRYHRRCAGRPPAAARS